MASSLTVNGSTYSFPVTDETTWGSAVTSWATAVSSHTLQKSGGTFTLTADVNFGATYGLLSQYFTSRTANAAAAGQVRLARADTVSWRNQANSSDLELGVDSSNNLEFEGVDLVIASNGSPAVVTFGYTSSAADTTTRYAAPGGPSAAAGTTEFALPMPLACKVSNLRIYSVTAPADNCVFVARKNGSDTAITATMASAATTASDTTNTVTFAAGDRLSIKHTMASATTAAANTTISFKLTLV